MQIPLEKIEREYQQTIQKMIDSGMTLTASTMVEFAVNMFQKLQVKDISDSDDADSDMLLFEYGIYNWGGELGEHFSFSITRQFIKLDIDEPYQLSLTLVFEANSFRQVDAYECWSMDFIDLASFTAHIKATKGFDMAENSTPQSYELRFYQC